MSIWGALWGNDDRAERFMDAENHKHKEVRKGQVVWNGILAQSKAKGAPTARDRAARARAGRKAANYAAKKKEAEAQRRKSSWWD